MNLEIKFKTITPQEEWELQDNANYFKIGNHFNPTLEKILKGFPLKDEIGYKREGNKITRYLLKLNK